MAGRKIYSSVILAEILRLQRWAGGDSVSAKRIFGLANGFESLLDEEAESFGISRKLQEKIEDVFEDIEAGNQSADGISFKSRLHRDRIDESDAACVLQYCRMGGRFGDAYKKLVDDDGAVFSYLKSSNDPEREWFGATHYMELIDCSSEERNKMYGVFAPAVPRVGELVTPQRGQTMEVIGIDHVICSQGDTERATYHILVPHVLLKTIEPDTE